MKKLINLMRVFALLLMLVGVSSSAFGAYYMKHPWGGGEWTYKQLDSNNQITDIYGGNGINIAESSDGENQQWIPYPTLVGSISTGTQCVFKYDPSTNTVTITPTGGGSSSGNLKEPYVISVYREGQSGQRFTFTPVPGSKNYEYEVLIEIEGYTGNPADYKYWVGEANGWKDGQSANYNLGYKNKADDDFVASCSTGAFYAKIYALQENGQQHGEARNYYIHAFACSEHAAKISLSSSVREFDLATPPESITLTATADDKSEGNYIWYKSEDGVTYDKITETTANTYTLSGSSIPTNERNYYKVVRKVVDSSDNIEAITVIYTVQSCGAESKGSNIFRQDFGELTAVRGDGSRKSFANIVSGYTYQPAPYKINDGYYAVVADPYYCGCGKGGDMGEEVTDGCLSDGVWFRQLRDHTLMNTGATGPYGGMLMINFNGTGIAYQRELIATEQASISKNSILKFSAYFASAAVQSKQDVTFFNPINMELKIQFQKTGSSTWKDAAVVHSEVKYSEEWQRSEVEWVVDEVDGKFRVVINNKGATGDGNDLLIDDVSLDLCTPAFTLYFVDENGNQTENLVAKDVTDKADVQVKQIDFGSLGEDPCMQLYKRDTDGTNTTYTYVSDLTLSSGYYTTNIFIESLLTEIPGAVELVAVASAKDHTDCDASVKPGVENGTFKPGAQNNVIFSGNFLTYSIGCGTSILSLASGEEKNICYAPDMVLPKLKLTSTNISSNVKIDILVDGNPILTDIAFASDINISELYKTKNGTNYLPKIGTRKITVVVKEFNEAGKVFCERTADGVVTINVMGKSDKPVTNRGEEYYAYNMCKTEGDDPAINDDKFFFNDLITSPADKSGLVWLTMDDKLIDSDSLFFYADKVQDKSVKVYNNPAGSCPSEPIIVRYRVKEITPTPLVQNYNECAIVADAITYKSRVENAESYKHLLFFNKENNPIKQFDPSLPCNDTIIVKASNDEIYSANDNNCESEAELIIKVKDYATAANIMAKDTTVCPGADLELIAKADFAKEQTNVKLTWYPDTAYSRDLAYGETFKYHLIDTSYKVNPDTVYVTVQSDDYCENIPSEAKPVVISQMEAVPALAITPESTEVVIGATPGFTVTPDDARYDLYVNDVKVSADATTYKPYLNSEYKLVYEGDCGSKTVYANVAVQWPTVFTPYVQDGRNDTFVKDMDPNFYTQIFTRFGTKIYESPNGWDGKVQGAMNGSPDKIAVPGVYYYVVQLPDGNVKKGTIEVFKY